MELELFFPMDEKLGKKSVFLMGRLRAESTGLEPATPERHSGATWKVLVEKWPNYEKKLQKLCTETLIWVAFSSGQCQSFTVSKS